jgi:DNA-directed RNA polymerase subunit RPC12/RpoP
MSKLTALPAELGLAQVPSSWRQLYLKSLCALFGHQVDNVAFERMRGGAKRCRCGETFLYEHGAETRISHTVSCFLFGHHYVKAGARDGHHEYVCFPCGHPLLFEAARDPYAQQETFCKKVRYLCNLFGHRVHRVAERQELTEYACDCGHSFLRREKNIDTVKHPLVCLLAGHFVRFVERRGHYAEYLCRHCGHTFCFVARL